MRKIWSITPTDVLRLPFGELMRGDGAPYWREGPTNKPQISAAEARRQRRLLVKLLDNAPECDRQQAEDLRRRLEACSRTDPCGSGACQVCWRAIRRSILRASWHLFHEPEQFRGVTAICAPAMVAHGGLGTADPLAAVERRLMTVATNSGVRIFGGLDISSNEHRQGRFQPHYMPHAHYLVPATTYEQHDTAWSNYFPRHDLVAKPVETSPYDGRRRWLAYCLHPIIDRRDSEAARVTADGTWKRANTRSGKPLRRPQRVELALMLDRVGIEARIISYGYDLLTDGNDVWMIQVDRQRADQLLAERRQRRAEHREKHRQLQLGDTMTPQRARFWL